ncbi:MAG: hypothetical protein LBC18_10755 [Opitutaceae bacterium]|jgi:hypothetical protein|nr:hypothetical protein [Opitutaceae bacterium]
MPTHTEKTASPEAPNNAQKAMQAEVVRLYQANVAAIKEYEAALHALPEASLNLRQGRLALGKCIQGAPFPGVQAAWQRLCTMEKEDPFLARHDTARRASDEAHRAFVRFMGDNPGSDFLLTAGLAGGEGGWAS